MTEPLYKLLAAIGYLHPIHPPITHLPVGMVIGAFLLGVISLLVHSQMAGRAARYCMIIALISLFPTALLGYADWQHFYAGGWLRPIEIKMLLAGVLLVLTVLSLLTGRGNERTSPRLAGIYTLSLLTVLALGFFGGEIVYSGRVPQAPPEFRNGQELFRSNCSGCHPYGSNIVDPKAELRGSDYTANEKTFIRWIRDPKLDNGSRGPMPPFTPSRISDAQASELLAYIIKSMGPAKPVP